MTKSTRITFTELLVYLSILVSPLRCYGIVVGGVNFSLFRIFGLAMVISVLISGSIRFKGYVSFLLLIVIALTLFQSFFSPYLSGAYSNFFSFAFGFVWIFFAYQYLVQKGRLSRISKVFIASSFFPLVLGLYQWLFYKAHGVIPSLPFPFLISSEGKTGLTYNTLARITSCFGDPAYMSTFYVIVFLISFQSLICVNTDRFTKIVCLIVIGLVILEIVMSMSGSGVFALAVGAFLLFILNTKRKRYIKKFVAFFAIFTFVFVLYFIFSGSNLIDRFIFKMSSEDQTSSNFFGRLPYLQNAFIVFLHNPLLGGGFGSLRLNDSFSSAHSSLVTVLCQQGIVVFFIVVFLLIIYPLYKYSAVFKKTNLHSEYFSCYLAALLSIVFLSLAYDTLFSLDSCYTLIAVVLFLCDSKRTCVKKEVFQYA